MDETLATPADGITRRSAVTKIAVGTAVVWAAPAITTLGSRASAGSAPPAELVFHDDFDEESVRLSESVQTMNFFVTGGGNIDVIGDQPVPPGPYGGNVYDPYPGNGRYIDLDGTASNGVVTFATKTAFPAGNYRVDYLIGGGNDGNVVTAALGAGGRTDTINAGGPAATLTFNATVTTPSPLSFSQSTGDNQGAILLEVWIYLLP